MSLLGLAIRSLLNRRAAVVMTLASMVVGVALLIGVGRLHDGVRAGFATTISGTDLIVGPRSGALQLVLSSLFRLGSAEHAMPWGDFERVHADPEVAWAVPLALGDSHRGLPVVATNGDYFRHLKYGHGRSLAFAVGRPFQAADEVVLGAEAAQRFGYRVGDELELTHGVGEAARHTHEEEHFKVVGVLAPTGTPIDRSLHILLAGMARLHAGWIGGVPLPGVRVIGTGEHPERINAVLVGLKQRTRVFELQHRIQNAPGAGLAAVLPAVALEQLWAVVMPAERALRLLALLVFLASALGMGATLLAGLEARRRELAVLRAIGAAPRHLLSLLLMEGGLITLAGIAGGLLLALGLFAAGEGWLLLRLGVAPSAAGFGDTPLWLLGLMAGGVLAGAVPAWRAYRQSLADGLMMRE